MFSVEGGGNLVMSLMIREFRRNSRAKRYLRLVLSAERITRRHYHGTAEHGME